MSTQNYRKLSKLEAFANMGLHPKDSATYFLENLIITVKETTLSITVIPTKNGSALQGTYETDSFVFNHKGSEYLLKAENNILNAYEKEEVVEGDM